VNKILVCGGGGFIGHHLVNRLKEEGHKVTAVDLKLPEFSRSQADKFEKADLRDPQVTKKIFRTPYDEVYQLAADMGGADFIFTGKHDADLMTNSALINLNVLNHSAEGKAGRIFFSSSACIYPERNQLDPDKPNCEESSAYPAAPDSEYGWEKIFSERLYFAYAKNRDLKVRIARFHNIFGEEGSWRGGREKAPAALCRKVATAQNGGEIEIYGDGKQTRTFLHIEECLEGILKLTRSDFSGPVNLGSEEMISINDLARLIMKIANKDLKIKNIDGPRGVRGRSSDNRLIKAKLKWAPSQPLVVGLTKTYLWIHEQATKAGLTSDKAVPSRRAA
jgi:GDP-D-mannose 3', 5'-epimerase